MNRVKPIAAILMSLVLGTLGAMLLADECDLQPPDWAPFGDINWPGVGDECSFIVGLVAEGGMIHWGSDELDFVQVDFQVDLHGGGLPDGEALRVFDIKDYEDEDLVAVELLDVPRPSGPTQPLAVRLVFRDGSGRIGILEAPGVELPRSAAKLRVVWQRAPAEGSGSVQLWGDLGHGLELLASEGGLSNGGQVVQSLRFGSLGSSSGAATGEGFFHLGAS